MLPSPAEVVESWNDEQTVRFNFDKADLTPEDRLVIGYLMMEEHGLFAELDAEEQIAVARRLKNAP
ncbi:MAG TPA: hypothetical protein VN947_20760 [Polyangia bacterium]|nr:hypothetical protein [Polyangia bacterium]